MDSKPTLENITTTVANGTVYNHEYITMRYSYYTYILTYNTSILISDPGLRTNGSIVTDTFNIPLDPDYVLQRVGYACMDEGL